MTDTFHFPAPVPVDPANRPPSPIRGGRQSLGPAYREWLESLQPGAEWEFAPVPDADGNVKPNSVSRLNSIRKVAKQMNGESNATRNYKVEQVPLDEDGKTYRIFAKVSEVPAKGK